MNAVFYRNDDQKKLAEASVAKAAEKAGIEVAKVKTKIIPATDFTYAEDYHQKYRLRRYPTLIKELEAIYPDFVDLSNSTVATKLNAYAGGYGTKEQLEAEITEFGLSEAAQSELLKSFRPRKASLFR